MLNKLSSVFLLFLLFFSCKNEKPKADTTEPGVVVDEDTTMEQAVLANVKSYHKGNAQKVVSGFHSPESVATDGTYYYVSNVGRELLPSEKDGDGFISQLNADGEVLELKWMEGLDAPKGMAILNGVIYTADVDKVRGFDIKRQKKVFEIEIQRYGTVFLNDLVVKDNQYLLVSATDIGYIFEVDTYGEGGFEIFEIYGDMTGVNGLFFDVKTNRLLMAGFGIEGEPVGVIMEADLNQKNIKQTELMPYQGYLDGIQLVEDKYVLFTDWKDFEKGGQLMVYNLESKKVQAAMEDVMLGPADFYYEEKSGVLWLPLMAENELVITHLELEKLFEK